MSGEIKFINLLLAFFYRQNLNNTFKTLINVNENHSKIDVNKKYSSLFK